MLRNNNSEEECFLEEQPQEHVIQQDIHLQLPTRIPHQMPANELRSVRRPDSMAPRTFFLDSPRSLLPEPLNMPCQELPPTLEPYQDAQRLKLRIVNSKNLSIEQYFARQRFRCLYNKLEGTKPESRTFTGRLKGIDSLVDYNWKNFRQLTPPQQPKYSQIDQLDADFESGNMCRAYVGGEEHEYYLLVENDVNTYGYNNWFFFRCRAKGAGIRRFSIPNLAKKTSFFAQGMMVSVWSRRRWEQQRVGWFKGAKRITFSSVNFLRPHHDNQSYSCLAFQYDFEGDDQVFFALNQPYTYSRLVNFLKERVLSHTEVKHIGYSISNNIMPAFRSSLSPKPSDIILVIARQHPCETTGSFIAEFLMRHLMDKSSEPVRYLLYNFEFVVIPMLNPDGVIHGTSRCNMAGLDLNRQWGEEALKELSPQVAKVKQLISSLSKGRRIKYMLDLHGHGKKLSSFFFSCTSEQHYRLLSQAMRRLQRRFSLAECTYGISRDKENTIRSKINSMGIAHSYTLETSLFGWRTPQGDTRHFNQSDYEEIALNLINSIFLLEAPSSLTQKALGITRDALAEEINTPDPAQKQPKVQQNVEALSESDPEGDRLDVKDLLCKCENRALKKRLQELQRRKLKKQKAARNLARLSSARHNKNDSCPNGFFSGKLASLHSALGREVLVKLEAKSTAKKVSFSQKWEVRRREIVERQQKLKTETETAQREKTQGPSPISKPRRTRIKSEVSAFVDHNMRPPSATAKQLKKKPLPQKMKTQFREAEEMMLSAEQIKQSESRKSALQLRFKQLKQESLNVILTDTLSISKLLPEKDKERLQQPKSIKNMVVRTRSDYVPTCEPSAKHSLKEENLEQTLKYKKFKQFLNGQSPSKKLDKNPNSVFYYFPVL